MHNLSRDDYPLNTVADVEKPTHSVIINAESVAGQTTIGDNTSDETEVGRDCSAMVILSRFII